jgi:hypothetical protein
MVTTFPDISIATEFSENIEFDETGKPLGCYSVNEVFDKIGKNLIAHFGEDFGKQLNKERYKRGLKPIYNYGYLTPFI